MLRPDDTTIPWPVGRKYHSSCLLAGPLTGHQHPVVVMMGGWDSSYFLSDLWIMKGEEIWQKVCLNNTHVHVKCRRCLCLMVCIVVSNKSYCCVKCKNTLQLPCLGHFLMP